MASPYAHMPTSHPVARLRGIIVEVRGLPKPAGSKRVFLVGKGAARRPVVTDDCRTGRDWRASVQDAIARAYDGPPLTGPLELNLVFTMPRPRGHFTRRGMLRPSAPECPTTRPDRSKLCRAVEDAATGLLWRDDSQIVAGSITKRYGERIGVVIQCHAVHGLAREG